MAFPYSKWCFPKPQYVSTTKAHLSTTTNNANKWNILHQNPSTSPLISPPLQDDIISIKHAEKLMELKHVLLRKSSSHNNNSLQGLHMIDAIQRLNVDYHFQDEIDAFLQRHYVISTTSAAAFSHHDNLHHLALSFRLLRQQGHFVPQEVFEKFTDKEGKFKQELLLEGGGNNNIVKGVMDLYEASQVSIKGEDMLDEAGEFSLKFLKERLAFSHNDDDDEAKLLRSTMETPFHKSLPMFTALDSFQDFHGGMNSNDNGWWFGSLKTLAKMDLTLLQRLYKKEIIQISKWWTKLGLANELKYARNQPLKWYIWSLACLSDPNLSQERIELTKPISFIYIIDDIFDVYGTLDELTLFTDVVSRWDVNTVPDELPDYMKVCFRALYDVTNEISFKIYQKHGWEPKDYLRKTWERLCKAFLVEAKWFDSGKNPSAEEYLKNGIISSGVHIVLIHIFFMLGEGLTNQNVKIIDGIPDIISSTATILRLWDDLGNAEDENQEGNDGSYVDCLLMEKKRLSRKEARDQVMNLINDAWKRLNQECLFERTFPAAFRKASLNLARMVPLMYTYDNNHSLPKLEQQVKSLIYQNNSLFI
ncbi:hypothetical protein PIB30_046284 [Stylosanthes scabra]|uniref:Uncharacterized protein n=1 Tax=Stylosanthes scabra TaxID=79078 RepID=A0ABU6QFT6_9FABA|nr:hypothetical protein [Stylosanthes scabra]